MCSAIQMNTPGPAIFTTAVVTGNAKEIGVYAIAKAANDLATRGAEPIGVSVQIMLPGHAYESRLKAMVVHMEKFCEELGIQITCAEAEVTPALTQALVTATAMGQTESGRIWQSRDAEPGQDIVLTGFVGLEGMLRVMSEKESELKERFVGTFISQIKAAKSELSALKAIRLARDQGVSAMQQIGKGGILATLWEVAEAANLGMSVSLPDMTIRQETIEVCEFYHLNPYQMTSTGAVLMYTDDGKALVRRLQEAKITASLIGRTGSEKERIITGGAEIRYMDRPQPDELGKIWNSDDCHRRFN
ncbi:MAG: AIR synthase related protein [Hespellia sp.]|nr:AIR synthase related protein [Hespellia sp.]